MDWKEEWEKEQRGTNRFVAALFGLFALPWWIKWVYVGLFFTAFWGIMFLVYWNGQPHSYEDFAEMKKMDSLLHPKLTPRQHARYSLPDRAVPNCPICGSDNVRKLYGMDVDVNAVDTFVETDDAIRPVCLQDYMCRWCGHK